MTDRHTDKQTDASDLIICPMICCPLHKPSMCTLAIILSHAHNLVYVQLPQVSDAIPD